ncbi:MAG: Ca-activated chloride channel [Acidobacteriota bacterium]|jgi:Ca-activated chloride channel family protein|nr:Ca-activated chloride channel [Acidobacteriota bacterium]
MRRCSPSLGTQSGRASLCVLLWLALVFAAPNLYAQSGRIKQPVKPSTGTTRPKRATTNSDSQNQTPQPTSTPPVRLPGGTVVMDETPPPPRPTPTPAPDTSGGEEVGVEDVVRITSNLVTVPASVVDAQGRAVIDLKLEDFELRVDGQPRPISDLNRSEVPVTLALLFDNSSSLTSAREFEKQAAVKFFRSVIRPIDRAAIYSVATEVNLVQPLTNSVSALVQTVEHFGKPEGATKLLDAIVEASNYLRPYPGRKVIVIVSDGEDTLSDNTNFDDVLRRVLAADCQVYAVQTKQIEYAMLTGTAGNANIRALAAERRLEDLTGHTGGALYTPIQTADLDAAFTQISADLAQQYILSYYPTDDNSDGRFRIISVRISTRQNMRVRARRGYYPRRPNERFISNTQLPAASEPSISSNQLNAASKPDSSQSEQSRTDSLPSIASNSAAQKISGSVPARSRRVGPSETNDEPDTTSSSVAATTIPEEPIIRADKATTKASEPTPSPPPKPAPGPTPPATNARPPVPNSSPTVSNPTPPAAAAKPVSGGVLNGKAISLPKPLYPQGAKSMHVSGMVTVEVLLNEEGKVISARAVEGIISLRQAAVDAARLARFSPTMLSGQPVKVVGFINYKFSLAD